MNEVHYHINETAGFALLSNVMFNVLKRNGWNAEEVHSREREFYLMVCEAVRDARSEIQNEINAFVNGIGFDEQALQAVISGVYAIRGFDLAEKLTKQRQSLCN
jgi:hypothetical protein